MQDDQKNVHVDSLVHYYQIVLIDKPDGLFTYSYHSELRLQSLVEVFFGRQKRVGVITQKVSKECLGSYTIKSLVKVLNEDWLTDLDWSFIRFAQQYYCTPLCSVLKTALPKPLIESFKKNTKILTDDCEKEIAITAQAPVLTIGQAEVVQKIIQEEQFSKHLIFGVTGSGKTLCYLKIAVEYLKKGNILYLVPEIHLTTQLCAVFRNFLDADVVLYHSLITPKQRVLALAKARYGKKGTIFLGARSAIFLPINSLALIVIDEEHDHSFKNHEGDFRYHARDLALYKAQLKNIPCILGSATPSSKWLHDPTLMIHRLKERATGYALPVIELASVNPPTFEQPLDWKILESIRERLEKKEQVLIFLNQKGYAPRLFCPNCQDYVLCASCEAPLTVYEQHLVCQYCAKTEKISHQSCHHCGEQRVLIGFGCQRLVEFLKDIFPKNEIIRMDGDTLHSVKDFAHALEAIERTEGCIIVGTQMIAKGYDWPRVTLAVLLIASFQIRYFITPSLLQQVFQVSGRAGRHAPGSVLMPVAHQDFSLDSDLYSLFNYDCYEENLVSYHKDIKDCPTAHVFYQHKHLTTLLGYLSDLKKHPLLKHVEYGLDYPPKKKGQWQVILRLKALTRKERSSLIRALFEYHAILPELKKHFSSIEIDPLS